MTLWQTYLDLRLPCTSNVKSASPVWFEKLHDGILPGSISENKKFNARVFVFGSNTGTSFLIELVWDADEEDVGPA